MRKNSEVKLTKKNTNKNKNNLKHKDNNKEEIGFFAAIWSFLKIPCWEVQRNKERNHTAMVTSDCLIFELRRKFHGIEMRTAKVQLQKKRQKLFCMRDFSYITQRNHYFENQNQVEPALSLLHSFLLSWSPFCTEI